MKEFSIILDKDTEYTVDIGGTLDPENVELTFENLGENAVVNPRMTVNGLYDWYDVKSMVAEATRDCKTDEEKALALWDFVLYRRFQRSPTDRSALHPVRAMNGYGYGICGHTSAWLKCLWKGAGVEGRVQEIWGHTVSEASYEGNWHMLDGNVKVFYLDRDNRTIASLATLEHDKELIERTIHARDAWVRGPDTRSRNQQFVRYITSHKDNYEEHSYDGEITKDYNMAMTLKPGEKLVRWWKPELGKFEGRDRRAEAPERYANGQLIWEPDLRRINVRPYLSVPGHGNVGTRAEDGRDPAIHVADLQDKLHTRPSLFSIPIASPYPILGARFTATVIKEGESGSDMISIYYGQPGLGPGGLYTLRYFRGSKQIDLDLDSSVGRSGPIYRYSLGFTVSGNAEAKPPTQSGLDAFRFVSDLQVSPHSIPALALGKNKVRFWSQSTGATKVRITHRWREIDGQHVPGNVEAAVALSNSGEVDLQTPTLKWTAATDPDAGDKVTDYQVMVSLRPDCRWPLSPTLHQNVGSDKTEWTIPIGFLNSGTQYYWKVRARDSNGNIGEWSPVFSFKTSARLK